MNAHAIIQPRGGPDAAVWARLLEVDPETMRLRTILRAMARGEDVWREFLDMLGRFILHVLSKDYGFFQEYDEHARQEILHDIYLRAARYAPQVADTAIPQVYRAYLRKIIRTIVRSRQPPVRMLGREISLEELREHGSDAAAPRSANPLRWLEVQRWLGKIRWAAKEAIRRVAQRSRDPGKTRFVLERRLLRGASYSEIAEEVGMELDAVRHVVHYYRPAVIREMRKILGRAEAEGNHEEEE